MEPERKPTEPQPTRRAPSQYDVPPKTIAIIVGVMLAGLAIGMLLIMPHYGPRKPRHRSALGHVVPTSMIGRETNGMMWIPGATFLMGVKDGQPDETPEHEVTVGPFWMDKTEVTNEEFQKFVDTTGYVTVAESRKAAANWRHPEGRESSIAGKERHPVVQVAWVDAEAYAQWAGKRLPTEAEWEHAARGGLHQQPFAWGPEKPGDTSANIGRGRTTPVGQFAPNGYGLYDVAGNVWEWCHDWYQPEYYKQSPKLNPRGPDIGVERVIRGGSFRSIELNDGGYRVGARMRADPDTGRADLGFRCVKVGL